MINAIQTMTKKQQNKAMRNAAIANAFARELKANPRRSDAAIIEAVMPLFPDIKSPITIRTIVGRAGLLK